MFRRILIAISFFSPHSLGLYSSTALRPSEEECEVILCGGKLWFDSKGACNGDAVEGAA
jgi:hypothetical protein